MGQARAETDDANSEEPLLNLHQEGDPYINWFAPRMEVIAQRAAYLKALLSVPKDFDSAAGGFPPAEFLPVDLVRESAAEALNRWGPDGLQYSPPEGFYPLREASVSYLRRLGVDVTSPDEIIITSSSQAALDTFSRLCINPGDGIAVEAPTYLGALAAFDAYGAVYASIPKDRFGMMPDRLKHALYSGRIKFIYVDPTFGNPSGDTMSFERRREILEVVSDYEQNMGILVPILEDDPYSMLRYQGNPVATFQAIDRVTYGGRYVAFTTTFSKTLAPGLRLGEVVAPPRVLKALVQAKSDLCTGAFVQGIATVFIERHLDSHIKKIVPIYEFRRNTMLSAMIEHFPDDWTWNTPEGGMFIWGKGDKDIYNTVAALEKTKEKKVAFVPGVAFYPNPDDGTGDMRLNFSQGSEESIWRLCEVIGDTLKDQARAFSLNSVE